MEEYKMKKIITLFLMLALVSSLVLAAQGETGSKGIHEPGTGLEDPELKAANQGTGQGLTNLETTTIQTKAKNQEQLQQMIQQKKQEMNQEMESMSEGKRNVYRNQNQVREAVHALLAMEDLAGGIGKQVSAVAREFDNSVQKTIQTEEKIQTRGAFARFFAGGDFESAEELDQEVNQNQQRIQQLKQLRTECQNEVVCPFMDEQVKNLEQEQTRLQQLAQKEKQSKGLLGWMWK